MRWAWLLLPTEALQLPALSIPGEESAGLSNSDMCPCPSALPSFPALPYTPHLCAQGTKPPLLSSPQFPWASPAEFTIWKQASGAGLEPEEARAKLHWLPSP